MEEKEIAEITCWFSFILPVATSLFRHTNNLVLAGRTTFNLRWDGWGRGGGDDRRERRKGGVGQEEEEEEDSR